MEPADQRLKAIAEPGAAMARPSGTYASFAHCGDLIFSSGVVARESGEVVEGALTEHEIARGEKAVRLAATSILLGLQHELGSLERVKKAVTLNAYLRTADGFTSHVRVMDVASRLIEAVFPGAPYPARTTVGVASLPANGMVELSMSFELKG